MIRSARLLVGAAVLGFAFMGASAAEASYSAHGSVEQVYVTGLDSGARMSLLDRGGDTVATKRANELGGLLFRRVDPGSGYRVRLSESGKKSAPLTVLSKRSAPPSTDVYDQSIPTDGYGYLTTRDGTRLAYTVHPPTNASIAVGVDPPQAPGGPYPTLIEYSGYGYADPSGPTSGIAAVANAMGFAVVDIQMRGTGCSGGAFDFFEPLQSLDGYDIVETVARQPWVKGHKVGMVGISYGGISQLFTAQTRPPHLAAISPLSVIDATATTLYPGGNLNTGFAVAWAKERQQEAQPAGTARRHPAYADQRVADGDTICRDNQALHGEAANLMAKIRRNNHYRPKVADPLDPVTFVHKINVPTFMACQFQDEQTGGHCPSLVRHFTGTKKKWFTFTNGAHIDSLDPETLNRLYDFLQLYVAEQPPVANAAEIRAAAPVIYQLAMGIRRRPDHPAARPGAGAADVRRRARGVREAEAVRVLFDNGAGSSPNPRAGHRTPATSTPLPPCPCPASRPSPGISAGRRAARPAPTKQVDRYRSDPRALPDQLQRRPGAGGLWGNARSTTGSSTSPGPRCPTSPLR